MKSKIEKLKLVNHDLIVDFDRIESKINEIIDHLNSQDQEEEEIEKEAQERHEEWKKRYDAKYPSWAKRDGVAGDVENNSEERIIPVVGETKPMSKKEWKEFCKEMEDSYPVTHGDEEIKDTPEERGIAGTTDDDMKGITPEESDVQEWEEEWHSTPVYNQISFIKNLLEEREDRAREEVMFTEDEQRVLRFALKLQRDDIHKVWDEETFGTIWKKVGGLSKLTTK